MRKEDEEEEEEEEEEEAEEQTRLGAVAVKRKCYMKMFILQNIIFLHWRVSLKIEFRMRVIHETTSLCTLFRSFLKNHRAPI